jgi:hypothetical protein
VCVCVRVRVRVCVSLHAPREAVAACIVHQRVNVLQQHLGRLRRIQLPGLIRECRAEIRRHMSPRYPLAVAPMGRGVVLELGNHVAELHGWSWVSGVVVDSTGRRVSGVCMPCAGIGRVSTHYLEVPSSLEEGWGATLTEAFSTSETLATTTERPL